MKVRKGFVSNSSSSSFVIYGVAVSPDNIKNSMENLNIESCDCFATDIENVMEHVEKLTGLEVSTLDVHIDYEGSGDAYIGKSFTTIGDNETGECFKNNIEIITKETFGDIKCKIHDREIYG